MQQYAMCYVMCTIIMQQYAMCTIIMQQYAMCRVQLCGLCGHSHAALSADM